MFREIRRYVGTLTAIGLVLAGCGDTNVFDGLTSGSGEQAKLERGKKAINDGDWEEAISIFEEMNEDDPDVRIYLASAYVGRAGFDTLELVKLIDEAQEDDSDGSVLYDSVTSIFGDADGDGVISSGDLAAKEADVAYAIAILTPGGQAQTEDEVFQAGMYAALHTIILLADLLDADDVSQEAIEAMPDGEIDSKVTDDRFDEAEESLETDLRLISDAIEAFVDSDLSEDFDEFVEDIGFEDDDLTAEDVRGYLKSL